VTDLPDPEANEADVLEQETEVDPAPPAADGELLDDPLVEADEADLLEQSQSVPEDDPDDVR
jgi:hypothetical protein